VTELGGRVGQAVAGRVRSWLSWGQGTVLGDVVARFFQAEMLDRSFVLAAQAFVAFLPIVLILTSAFASDNQQNAIADQINYRFGLAGAAATVVQTLFTTPGVNTGVYWLGLLITLFSAFSLSKRVGRAYASIWRVSPLNTRMMWWRGLAWIAVELGFSFVVTQLRDVAHQAAGVVSVGLFLLVLLTWGAGDVVTQNLLLRGQIPLSRLWVSGLVTAVLRAGVAVWSVAYLPASLSRQAIQYGPVGVVFALFTLLLALAVVTLLGPLVAATVTERDWRTWFRSVPTPVTASVGEQRVVEPM